MKAMFRAVFRGFRSHFIALLSLTGIGAVLVLAGTGGIYVASHYPGFCASCHYMEPYYRQWQSSSHSDEACITCHPFRPVTVAVSAMRYATGTQDARPRAEVADGLCLQSGCHEDRLLDGDLAFKDKIRFDHQTHLTRLRRGKKLHCTSCHSQVVQGTHVSVTEETCYLCHFKGVGEAQAIGGCTNCHGTPEESVQHGGFVFSHESYLKVGVTCQQCHLKVTEGEGSVPQRQCLSCHVERLERYEDPAFIHTKHVTEHEVDCFRCHERIQHGEIQMIRALDSACENCHKGLHSAQKEMYIGAGGEGVPDTPSRMFAAQVTCDGCHTKAVHLGTPEFDQASLEAERQSCVTCHGKGYDLILDDWVREMDRLTKALEPEVQQAETVLKRAEAAGAEVTEARLLIEKARHNYDFLKFGRGVHNVEYALNLTKSAGGFLDQAMGQLKQGYTPPERPGLMTSEDAYCSVMCHARTGLPEETQFDRLIFPHDLHASGLEVACTKCHSPEKHKMRVITRSECMACHHEAEDMACGQCHPEQESLYTGKLATWGGEDGDPDVMFEGEVECTGCHHLSEDLSIEAIQAMCVDCHEAGYDEMLGEWINEVRDALGRVLVLAEDVKQGIKLGRTRGRNTAEAARLLQQAEPVIQLIEKGKGSHNHPLSVELLEGVEAQLKKALVLVQSIPPAP